MADAQESIKKRVRAVILSGSAIVLLVTAVAFVSLEAINFRAQMVRTLSTLATVMPDIASLVRDGRRAERWMGTADLPNFFRKPYGHGWALVGDAGYHKDPITGYGITDAFRDAGTLADALDAAFSGALTFEDALAG